MMAPTRRGRCFSEEDIGYRIPSSESTSCFLLSCDSSCSPILSSSPSSSSPSSLFSCPSTVGAEFSGSTLASTSYPESLKHSPFHIPSTPRPNMWTRDASPRKPPPNPHPITRKITSHFHRKSFFPSPSCPPFSSSAIIFMIFTLCTISGTQAATYWRKLGPIPMDTALDSYCKTSLQCLLFVPHAHCEWNSRTCQCQSYHVKYNDTTCLPASLLGYGCSLDAQCTLKVPNSKCNDGKCQCESNFVSYRKDKCLPPAKVDSFCLNDIQCTLAGKYSYCKYIIPRVYGKCRCPIGYIINPKGQCLPGLGKRCDETSECEDAIPNSYCKPATFRSIHARSFEAKCTCRSGYEMGSDKQSCIETYRPNNFTTVSSIPSPTAYPSRRPFSTTAVPKIVQSLSGVSSSSGSTPVVPVGSSEEKSLISSASIPGSSSVTYASSTTLSLPSSITSEETEDLNPVVLSTSTMAPTMNPSPLPTLSQGPNHLFINLSSAVGPVPTVSLGKQCNSSLECQVRDPYSICLNGFCECSTPSPRCSSMNRGCHNDTFQCRNGQCISWYFVCDKNKNCDDGSDEEYCIQGACPKEAFQCNDGTCLSRASVCNGRWECPDGSDEARCYKGIKCDPKSYRCQSGQCLPQYTFCNAVTDCVDGSDEKEEICENSQVCPKGTFQCGNNRCRSTAILCSGVDGCGDNSDEDRCEVCYCEKPMNLRKVL